MAKVNVSLDDDVRLELNRMVPPRKRSQVINEALRKELLRRKRAVATDRLLELRQRTARFSAKEILTAVQRDRARSPQ